LNICSLVIWFAKKCKPLSLLFLVKLKSSDLWSPPWLGWLLWNICVTNDHGYVPLVLNTSRSFPHSWLITGFVTRLIRRVSLVKQELLTLPDHFCSPPIFNGIYAPQSVVLYVCFVDRCLSFCPFSIGHCVACSSSIYGLSLPLWYLQTLLVKFVCLIVWNDILRCQTSDCWLAT
jgi:hypothetical protein